MNSERSSRAHAAPPRSNGSRLGADSLYHPCPPSSLGFETTADLEMRGHDAAREQDRAVDAIRFGVGIRRRGYHLFAMGPAGMGKHTIVRRHLEKEARSASPGVDWCYVHNFDEEHKPRALRFPSGDGKKFAEEMGRLVDELSAAIGSAFETEEYRNRVEELEGDVGAQQQKELKEIESRAREENLALLHTPNGIALAPMKDDDVMDASDFQELPDEERERYEAKIEELQDELKKVMHQVPRVRREIRKKRKELDRDVADAAVRQLFDEIRESFGELDHVLAWLDDVREDVLDHAGAFRRSGDENAQAQMMAKLSGRDDESSDPTKRYRVNVLVSSEGDGAPVVHEEHPTYQNLVGRTEHEARMGALKTDLTLIKAGALHRANGGYLIVDALELLRQPYAWQGLIRSLRTRKIRIESLGQMLGALSTVTLEPEPIDLDVKVVLVGERKIYYLLQQLVPEFADLFKVQVDFEEEVSRSDDNERVFANLVASMVNDEELLAFDAGAVARIIEQSSRLAEDTAKLDVQRRDLVEMLREADYWAREAERDVVSAEDVQRAIDEQIRRADRMRDRMQEQIHRGTLLIDVDGAKTGQVNGLAVFKLGRFGFGKPTRITARARLGSGKVTDIERESELGRPLHSKGVMILSGYLAGHFVPDKPLSLSASLVFEQSYGGVAMETARRRPSSTRCSPRSPRCRFASRSP